MRVLIDIGHPAHIHLFRNFARLMGDEGHAVLLTCREREHVIRLIEHYQLNYVNFGRHFRTLLAKLFGLVMYSFKMIMISGKFKPDIFLSHGSIYSALASRVYKKPHVSFEDTFNMEQVRLYLPITDVVLTGEYQHPCLGRKEIRFPGYHELAYLHPELYKPSKNVLDLLGVDSTDKYAIVRFVSWDASHDIGHKGISYTNKIRLVNGLAEFLKVFVSSESELPPALRKYQIHIKPEHMHDALYHAHLFVGESATMASESACLGTPAIYINDSQLGYVLDLEKYGLAFSYTESEVDQQYALLRALEIAQLDHIKEELSQKHHIMLNDKINVTAFLLWFVGDYPNSLLIMKSDPGFVVKFH